MNNLVRKTTLTLLCGLALHFSSFAQDEAVDTLLWKKKFNVGLTFNQASFSSNWIGGGVNSIGFNTFLYYKADYKKGIHSWDNTIDMSYGILKNEGQSARKSVDYILLDTKYGRDIGKNWNLFTALNFQSQFAKGYKYDVERPDGSIYDSLVSNFMAPAFLTSSWGAEWKPKEFFSLRLSPFAPRFTFVLDDEIANREVMPGQGPYGLDLGKNVRTEWLAFQAFADFNKDLSDRVNLKWKYLLFINYQNIAPENWDHRLDLTLTTSVIKYVNFQFGGILIYDKDQDDGVQLNQFLNIGIAYNFQNYKDDE